MDVFWEGAFACAGLGAVASFVLWFVYRGRLRLAIFQTLTKQRQYQLFCVLVGLTFLFAIAALIGYVANTTSPSVQVTKPIAALAPKASNLSIGAIRFSTEHLDQLDVLVRNTGSTVGVLDKAVLTVHALHPLEISQFRRATQPTTKCVAYFRLFLTPYTIEVPISCSIAPGQAEEIRISLLDHNIVTSQMVYEFSMTLKSDGKDLTSERILFWAQGIDFTFIPQAHNEKLREQLRAWTTSRLLKSHRLQRLIDFLAPM